MNKFVEDPDKICYWDLLEDVKNMQYDTKKDVSLWYMDDEGALKIICDDQAMLGLSERLKST